MRSFSSGDIFKKFIDPINSIATTDVLTLSALERAVTRRTDVPVARGLLALSPDLRHVIGQLVFGARVKLTPVLG